MNQIDLDDNYRKLFESIPLLKNIAEVGNLNLLSELDYDLMSYKQGEIVIKQGSTCSTFNVILKGKLEVNIVDANGANVLIEHIVAPRAFSTPHLFGDDNRYPATFTAAMPTVILRATKDSFFNLLNNHPGVLKGFLRIHGCCNACTTRRLDILSRRSVRERLIVYFFRNKPANSPLIRIIHSLTQLAEYLNVSRPALSTEVNKLEDEGYFRRIDRSVYEITDKFLNSPEVKAYNNSGK